MTNNTPAIVSIDHKQLEKLRANTTDLLSTASKFTGVILREEQEIAAAGDVHKAILSAIKSIESERKDLASPILEAKKRLDARAKTISEPLDAARKIVKNALDEHARFVKEEERKAQKVIDDAAIQAAEDAEKDNRPDDAQSIIQHGATMTPEKKAPTRGIDSTISTRTTWKFEIEDKQKVPESYKEVNETKIREEMRRQVKGGDTPKIVGVRFYEHTEANTR